MKYHRICFYCGKEIAVGERYRLYPLDRPYANLFFHKEHFLLVEPEIIQYLSQNPNKIYNYIESRKEKNGKSQKESPVESPVAEPGTV